jgi:hypothetical protein
VAASPRRVAWVPWAAGSVDFSWEKLMGYIVGKKNKIMGDNGIY